MARPTLPDAMDRYSQSGVGRHFLEYNSQAGCDILGDRR
jgi:hypothetical protein